MTARRPRQGAALLLLATLTIGACAAGSAPETAPPTTTTCQEDEACWDWKTMGNRSRGFHLDEIKPCSWSTGDSDVIVVNMNDGVPCRR